MKKIATALLFTLALTACNNPFAPAATPSSDQKTTANISITPDSTDTTKPDDNTVQFGNITINVEAAPSYKIFLIALEDKGLNGQEVGCGDSAIAVDGKAGQPIDKVEDRISAALNELFSMKTKDFGESGYSNFLADSNLKVDSVTMEKAGHAVVKMSGTLSLAGVCDNPRVEAQISQTVLQFPEIASADISLNGKPLQDHLSLKE